MRVVLVLACVLALASSQCVLGGTFTGTAYSTGACSNKTGSTETVTGGPAGTCLFVFPWATYAEISCTSSGSTITAYAADDKTCSKSSIAQGSGALNTCVSATYNAVTYSALVTACNSASQIGLHVTVLAALAAAAHHLTQLF